MRYFYFYYDCYRSFLRVRLKVLDLIPASARDAVLAEATSLGVLRLLYESPFAAGVIGRLGHALSSLDETKLYGRLAGLSGDQEEEGAQDEDMDDALSLSADSDLLLGSGGTDEEDGGEGGEEDDDDLLLSSEEDEVDWDDPLGLLGRNASLSVSSSPTPVKKERSDSNLSLSVSSDSLNSGAKAAGVLDVRLQVDGDVPSSATHSPHNIVLCCHPLEELPAPQRGPSRTWLQRRSNSVRSQGAAPLQFRVAAGPSRHQGPRASNRGDTAPSVAKDGSAQGIGGREEGEEEEEGSKRKEEEDSNDMPPPKQRRAKYSVPMLGMTPINLGV